MQKKNDNFLEKIVKKDYNNELEAILEKKYFNEDVKSILLNILYKIRNTQAVNMSMWIDIFTAFIVISADKCYQ